MVSLYPNPPAQYCYKVVNPIKMGYFPGFNSLSSSTDAAAPISTSADNSSMIYGSEDPNNKKVRKPCTITKCRETWTDQEHDKFIEALHLFDRDWKKIEAFVGSKTVIQALNAFGNSLCKLISDGSETSWFELSETIVSIIAHSLCITEILNSIDWTIVKMKKIRSHAQKYFLKLQKNGTSEHVPPPRPKRKAAHPYPQNPPKNAVSQVTGPFQYSAALPEFVITPNSFSVPRNTVRSSAMSSWTNGTVPLVNASQFKDDVGLSGPTEAHSCSYSSNSKTPSMWPTSETVNQGKVKQRKPMKVIPDFAQVYSFIASVFDSNASDHLPRLKMMDPINVETVLILMKNLAVNLTSPEFENYRRLISSYAVDTVRVKSSSPFINLHADKRRDAIPSV